jgi:hypothetical protein
MVNTFVKGIGIIALRIIVHYFRAVRWMLRGTFKEDYELHRIGQAYLTGLLPGIIAGLRRGNG